MTSQVVEADESESAEPCPVCGFPMEELAEDPGILSCVNCGAKEDYCPGCTGIVPGGLAADHCSECGWRRPPRADNRSTRNEKELLMEVEQEWVPAHESRRVANVVAARLAAGWTLHSVTFGASSWLPPGAEHPGEREEGWLLLFFKPST